MGGSVSVGYYILRRILYFIPTIIGVVTIAFLLIHIAPGDPVQFFVGETSVTPEQLAFLRVKFGLDRPLYEQYEKYIISMLSLDLGQSIFFQRDVLSLILERFPNTLVLVVSSTIISAFLGVLLGVVAATKPYSIKDNILSSISMIVFATPVFWSAMMLLIVFSYYLGVAPAGGMTSLGANLTGINAIVDVLRHLILPAVTLGLWQLALVFRMSRVNMIETLRKDFILTARAKGLSERAIVYRHALKHILIPVLTVVALNFSEVIAGAVLIETMFTWPGLGRMTWQAAMRRDYPLLLGSFAFVGVIVIVVNIVVDISYVLIDPRVRYR